MKPEVRAQLPAFQTRYEGRIPWFYQDVKGLITIGVGCLVDPIQVATHLPMVWAGSDSRADVAAIEAEWRIIKNTPELAQKGAGAARQLCRLRLRDVDIDALMVSRAETNEKLLATFFAPGQYDAFPAEVQLFLHSMAWAMGAAFLRKWPRLHESLKAEDWAAAAANCKIKEEGNPGIVPRNKANRALLEKAAAMRAMVATPGGVDDDDRARVERLQQAWFDETWDAARDDARRSILNTEE